MCCSMRCSSDTVCEEEEAEAGRGAYSVDIAFIGIRYVDETGLKRLTSGGRWKGQPVAK